MATRVIDDSKLQNIAVAIQGKDGGSTMTVDEMPTRIATIPTQDNTTLNSLIDRSITSIENEEVTSIGAYAFHSCKNLTGVSFPKVASIGDCAFQNCTSLTGVSFSKVTSIGAYAFHSCKNLTGVSFPKVASIGNSAFHSCKNLTGVSFSKVTSISDHAFQNCTSLTGVSFSKVASIGACAFYACANLSIVILGKRATLSSSNAFSGADNVIVYVQPEDLSWYSTATNWSTLYAQDRIKSIEDLTGDDLVWYQEQLARYQAQTA